MTKAEIQNRIKKLAQACTAMEANTDIPAGWAKDLFLKMLPIIFDGEALQTGIEQ